jgi:hypothetical protein
MLASVPQSGAFCVMLPQRAVSYLNIRDRKVAVQKPAAWLQNARSAEVDGQTTPKSAINIILSQGRISSYAERQRRQRVSADCLCVSSTLDRVAETRCSRCRGAAAFSCVLANLEWAARANRAKPRGTGPGAASATLNGKTRTAQNDLRSARRKPVHRPRNQFWL